MFLDLKEIQNLLSLKGDISEEYDVFNSIFVVSFDKDLLKKVYMQIILQTDLIMFGVGGHLVHRGYNCPGLKDSITVGGCNRGKLIKNRRKNSNVSHEYYYKNNRLQLVKAFDESFENIKSRCTSVEFVLFNDNTEIGLEFYVEINEVNIVFKRLKSVTLCEFKNNNLISYRHFSAEDCKYSKEEYNYIDNSISSVSYTEYGISGLKRKGIIEKDCICFKLCDNVPTEYFFESDIDAKYPISKINQQYLSSVDTVK